MLQFHVKHTQEDYFYHVIAFKNNDDLIEYLQDNTEKDIDLDHYLGNNLECVLLGCYHTVTKYNCHKHHLPSGLFKQFKYVFY